MVKKDLFLRFFGVLAILSLSLAACLPGIVSLPYANAKIRTKPNAVPGRARPIH